MAVSLNISVQLHKDPWPTSLGQKRLMMMLRRAAISAREVIESWIVAGEIEEGRGAYTCVILDPTKPRGQGSIADRILAVIQFGDAQKYLVNAAAKADAHDRHGRPNQELLDEASFCLNDDDFAWGETAFYQGAIAAGSGLSATQDREIAFQILSQVMEAVRDVRDQWLATKRQEPSGRRWFNEGDQPGWDYEQVPVLLVNPLAVFSE